MSDGLLSWASCGSRKKALREKMEEVEEIKRAHAFAAGYRTAQVYFGYGVPLADWEEEERLNAVKHGLTAAAKERVTG